MTNKTDVQNPAPVFCKDCAFFEPRGNRDGSCSRPVGPGELNLVTGQIHSSSLNEYCRKQREPLTRWERWRGVSRCGVEGKFFKPRNHA